MVMSGGFGRAVCRKPDRRPLRIGVKGLTCVSNMRCRSIWSGDVLKTRQIKKMISSYVGENKEFERQYLAGELEWNSTRRGRWAERCRAGGAGILGFFTRTAPARWWPKARSSGWSNGETMC